MSSASTSMGPVSSSVETAPSPSSSGPETPNTSTSNATNPQFSKVLSDATAGVKRDPRNVGKSPIAAKTDSQRRPRSTKTNDVNTTVTSPALVNPLAFLAPPSPLPTTTPTSSLKSGSSQASLVQRTSTQTSDALLNVASTTGGALDPGPPSNSFAQSAQKTPGLQDGTSTPSTHATADSQGVTSTQSTQGVTPSDASMLASVAKSVLNGIVSPSASSVRSSETTSGAKESSRRRVLPTSLGTKAPETGKSDPVNQMTVAPVPTTGGTLDSATSPLSKATLARHSQGVGSLTPPLSPVSAVPLNTLPSGPTNGAVLTSPAATSLNINALAGSISGALLDANGTYTVTLAMHPSELGHVQAVMSLNGTELHVALNAQSATGHQALANALENLKSELSQGGMNVNVSLRDPSSDQRQESATPSRAANNDVVMTDDVTSPLVSPLSVTSHINLIL